MKKLIPSRSILLLLLVVLLPVFSVSAGGSPEPKQGSMLFQEENNVLTLTDASGRQVSIPREPSRILCSGAGCLRLLTYLGCQDAVIAVDSIEKRDAPFDARPYALAYPEYRDLPLFGEFRGHDNPELIAALDPQPQVIFKTHPDMGTDPAELEAKTGIPVVVLEYGDLSGYKNEFYSSLRTAARIMGEETRGEAIIRFFEDTIADLGGRTADIPPEDRVSCYIGGVSYRGPHGFQSTEPAYPPFRFVNADNTAWNPQKSLKAQLHADVAKEMIIHWDPEVLFVDAATMQSNSEGNALYELYHDPVYRNLTAVREGRVYSVLPYNLYGQNFGSTLADAYYIGKILYPERFADIDAGDKADELYRFLLGRSVFPKISGAFGNSVFRKIGK